MPVFSVFTPTYNRAETLPRVWRSLVAQTFTDFEWIVVDDGSTDETQSLVENWSREARFPLVSIKQENRGKHVALNRAVTAARGDFFLVADSDDEFDASSLFTLRETWLSIPEEQKSHFAGVTARCRTQSGEAVGTPLPQPVFDSDNLELHYRWGVVGEKWGFVRTELMRQFPCDETPEMGSFPWGRIAAAGYKTRYIDKTLRTYYVNENRDTLSKGGTVRRPLTNVYRNAEVLNLAWNYRFNRPAEFLKAALNLARFSRAADWPFHRVKSLLIPRGARRLLALVWPISRLKPVKVVR